MVIDDPALRTAHVGISVYSPEEKRYLYQYQGDKYFVPASNVKIATCYAAMKYLGDSLTGGYYTIYKGWTKRGDIIFQPAGDPTFLHKDFLKQPLLDLLQNNGSRIVLKTDNWQEERWGNGWAWDDYQDNYMTERSVLPLYGNVVSFTPRKVIDSLQWMTAKPKEDFNIIPSYFDIDTDFHTEHSQISKFLSSKNNQAEILAHLEKKGLGYQFGRQINSNQFMVIPNMSPAGQQEIPFYTDLMTIQGLLMDTTKKEIDHIERIDHGHTRWKWDSLLTRIKTQPTNSVLKPMMHRSDNFFAEQSLLMVSNELLGVMNDERIIDTLLKTDFRNLPQKPRWVDGSGLSRYNLFTPQDFVFILTRMKEDFGMERIKELFPAGNEGTLKGYYTSDSSAIYAKTGTQSGIIALSGYLYTRKNKLLIFSVLVNNHQASSSEVRRAVERFILLLRGKNGS
jgi:serine-type D-Ala-D-Ala carboxypeptidase/endopeptidase (penicillin-binding protein 4)